MYSVTKRIEFCYGHRLLDYDGICKHPHGHNASVEIDVRTDRLDSRNMVVDFSDIKRIVKGWIDRELDHKMILRRDDPLVEPLKQLKLNTRIPLASGEHELTRWGARRLMETGAIDVMQFDCNAHAGITEWRKVASRGKAQAA